MYVRRIEGKWRDHPFWRKAFLVADAETLKLLRALGPQEIWIDTHKGVDEPAPPSPAPRHGSAPPPTPPSEPDVPRTEFGDDFVRAEAIRDRAKLAAKALFEEARMGRALRMENLVSVNE